MRLKKECPICHKTKFFWKFFGSTCKECNARSCEEYYENMSRERLLEEIRSSKKSKNDTPLDFLFLIGFFITFLYNKFLENPHVFSSSFWNNTKIIAGHIGEAVSFVLFIFLAMALFSIAYIAATYKFESKAGKRIATIILIIAMLFLYIMYLSD